MQSDASGRLDRRPVGILDWATGWRKGRGFGVKMNGPHTDRKSDSKPPVARGRSDNEGDGENRAGETFDTNGDSMDWKRDDRFALYWDTRC